MITVIIDEKNIQLDKIIIDEKNDVNHLKNSFRIKENEIIRAIDGKKEYICKVIEIEKKEVVLEIVEEREVKNENTVEIVAGISIIKNDKMELVIQKLTEIGIDVIKPIETKRTIVKLNEKKDKWDTVSREATKQCQRVKFLNIEKIQKIENINYEDFDLVIVPYECEEEFSLKNLLRENKNSTPSKILYMIGPEGGFDISEIEYLKKIKNVKIVTLGKNILRAETAAIVVGGILTNEFK